MTSLDPIEPFCVVDMRSGDRLVPPYVAVGTSDQQDAERQALADALRRYPESQITVTSVSCVGGGMRTSRTTR